MIKTFKHGDETQISPHFKASEFQCKCGAGHDFQLDTDLVDKLEKLFTALDCSKIVISSGFRCVEHDKKVGGTGTGQHTLGKAADFCCYGQDGKLIVTYNVCCAAQDVGFTGIARINDSYTHCDVRSSGKWYGDETKGNGSVTTDFYEYFKMQKEAKPMMNGIDISYCQPQIDWDVLPVDFVIIKAGQRDFTDPYFEQHYKAATQKGIPCGAYWYGEAKTIEAAKNEADCFIERLGGKKFDYPVYYDVEGDMLNLDSKTLTAIVKAFLERVEAAGYWVGLYMSGYPMHDLIGKEVLSRFALWVADTRGVQPSTYLGVSYGMWQYSWKGVISGIAGDVDLDYCYVDYPAQIKAKGLNGYGKQPDKPPEKPETDAGIEVEMTVNGKKYGGTLKPI